MSKSEMYEYAIIRLVPLVEREEFINIGVILYSKRKDYLDMKIHLDEDRILSFSKDIEIELIKRYLDGWRKVCNGSKEGGPIGQLEMHLRFRWLTANRSTIIQSSEVHPGSSTEPGKELDILFQKFVLQKIE